MDPPHSTADSQYYIFALSKYGNQNPANMELIHLACGSLGAARRRTGAAATHRNLMAAKCTIVLLAQTEFVNSLPKCSSAQSVVVLGFESVVVVLIVD